MSAKLRSLIDYLKAPLRLWRRGRQLPARVQIAVLVVGAVSVVAGMTVWTVARVRAQDQGGGGPTESVYDQVHRLRTEKNYDAAQTVARDFLTAHLERDNERQMVYFEYGLTLFDAQKWPEAGAAFEALVAEYADTALDPTAPDFVVDDAQYYAAVTQHYHGDKARGIALYEAFLQSFPESNRRPKALLMLAGAREQTGDLPGALPVFEQLVREFPNSEYAPEAQIHVGQICLGNKEYAAAAAAFEAIQARWPESKHVPTAVQFANRALIHQELDNWDPQNSGPDARTIDNSTTIESNAAALVQARAQDPTCAGVLLDLLNYHSKRAWWNEVAVAAFPDKLRQVYGQMQVVAPGAPDTIRASLGIAHAIGRDDPNQAIALLDAARQDALTRGDASLYNDSEFVRAVLLSESGQHAQARQVWEGLLQRDQDPMFEGEVKLLLGCTYQGERNFDQALLEFQAVSDDARYPDSVRATALAYQIAVLRQFQRYDEARRLLAEATAQYPNEASTDTAREELADLPAGS
jgi:TolA-binding protein